MSISSTMNICVLLSVLTIAIIIVGGIYWYTASKQLITKYFNDKPHAAPDSLVTEAKPQKPAEVEFNLPPPPPPQHTHKGSGNTLTISLLTSEQTMPHCNIVVSESGIATPGSQEIQQSISMKNVNLLVKQNQQIIKENFEHTNFVDCIHIVCGNKMLLTIIIQRTENTDTLEQAYVTINKSIDTYLNVEVGNVIVILDGLLNVKQTIGEQLTFSSSLKENSIQLDTNSQAPHSIVAPGKQREQDDNLSIIATDSIYGFDDRNSNTKFRQTIKDEIPKKYINHFKNILFP